MFNFALYRTYITRIFYHKTMKTQEPITPTWLVNRGYNIAQAARKIGRSAAHVNMVIHGKRKSLSVLTALRALPAKPFNPRERITTR